MKIWSYILSMADDVDCLPDALDSLAHFSDRIFVMDGLMGPGTLCHHPRYTKSIVDWMADRKEFMPRWTVPNTGGFAVRVEGDIYGYWSGVPIMVWDNSFRDPAHQRNIVLERMSKEQNQPDWICWIDSDEICSWEFINGIRPYLESLPQDIVGICPKWLTLVQDEQHCVKHQSDWLSHPRIHKPKSAYFQGNWHEHMVIDRSKVVQWNTRIIHTRALFTSRLKIQRGHDGIASGQTPLWADAEMTDIPSGVTWPTIHWPDGETPTPFH